MTLRYHILTLLLLIATAPAVLASATEETEREFTGDVFHIDSDKADYVLKELQVAGGECYYSRDDLYLLVYPVDFNIHSLIAGEDTEDASGVDAGVSGNRKRHCAPGGDAEVQKIREKVRLARGMKGKRNHPAMERARFAFGADRIVTGEGLPRSFDGSNVVVGFSDIGFDPNHSNFLTEDGEESRVKLFVNYNLKEGRRDVLDTPELISEYVSDDKTNYHATHVAGILAGRGTKKGEYKGMAPGADIVATTSTLHDVEILAGVEDIIAYSKRVGKPAVINLSLGNYAGPHDGTSLFSQYLDKCAEDAIICLSTGNEGLRTHHIG
ncbi:MAG: S8 family serine peptidase, partial [Muribaculaceae bacterium]|nr:S8 family serine peptidase [Muribaculaceae bacterium]